MQHLLFPYFNMMDSAYNVCPSQAPTRNSSNVHFSLQLRIQWLVPMNEINDEVSRTVFPPQLALIKTKDCLGEGRGSAPVHGLINQPLSCPICCNGKGPLRWQSCYSQRQKVNYSHLLIPLGLPGLVSWHRWRLLATIRALNGNWGYRLLSLTVTTQKECLLRCHQDKKKNSCCFQGPAQRNLPLVPGTKHPRCVYHQLTGSRLSRGTNSLQFVLTKAFIAEVQQLTNSYRQQGEERASRGQIYTSCSQSVAQTHKWLFP